MSFATSNRTAINVIEESVFGTTPTTPAFKALRFSGESLNYNISSISSNEIRSDRNTSDLIQVNAETSGDVDFELSFGPFNDLLEGVMCSDWGTACNILAATDIAFVSGTPDTITSSITNFVTSGLVAGQWIKISGCSTPTNNGYFKLSAVAANLLTINAAQTAIVSDPVGDPINIKGTMIRNGTTEKSYTIQKHLADVSQFFNFTGCRVSTMSLEFKTGAILTGKIGFMGLSATVSGTQIGGASVSAAATNTPMNAVSNVAEVMQDYTLMTAKFNSLTLSLNNKLRAQRAIGSMTAVGIALSQFELTGNIELYFEDTTMYNKYLNATSFALSFRVTDIQGNSYIFTIPAAKFETGAIVAGGLDQDIMFSATWRSIYDPASVSMFQIDQF